MESKKYEFTGVTKETWAGPLHRIRAIRDFRNVKAGDIGGWIEKEENLSHDGDCWVFGNAVVYGNARVFGDAEVTTTVKTFGNAFIYEITVTDKHIKIGCQQHLKSEWKDFEDRKIIEMDGKKALEFWRMFKPVLESLGLFEEV